MQHYNLHAPLLEMIKEFKKQTLLKDLIIYHGSREFSPHTDYKNKTLSGTRKWFSQDFELACSYANRDEARYGKKLLWKCQLKVDLNCLEGSQRELKNSIPWEDFEFPEKFPNEYYYYAKKITGSDRSIGFLDHFKNQIYREILIPNHNEVIDILDVIEL